MITKILAPRIYEGFCPHRRERRPRRSGAKRQILAPSKRGLSALADWGSVLPTGGHPHHHFVVPLPLRGRQDLAPSKRGLSALADWGSVLTTGGHPHHHFVVPLPLRGRQDLALSKRGLSALADWGSDLSIGATPPPPLRGPPPPKGEARIPPIRKITYPPSAPGGGGRSCAGSRSAAPPDPRSRHPGSGPSAPPGICAPAQSRRSGPRRCRGWASRRTGR